MQNSNRARSFGAVAADYARYRPSYPDDAVDAALRGPDRSQAPRRVLDLGAGTGALTRSLHARDLELVAVEPDPGMLAQLRADLPDVDARSGSAERIPLPDASVDAVLVGQAMHWFDLEHATPEMARVLRPGGALAGLWNHDDLDVEWLREAKAVAEANRPAPSIPAHVGEGGDLPAEPFFGPAQRLDFRWAMHRTVEGFLANMATHSWLLTSEPAERDAALARARDYLAGRPETASGEFDVPMGTIVWRTLRR